MKKTILALTLLVVMFSAGYLISSSGGKTGSAQSGCSCHGIPSAGSSTISLTTNPDIFTGDGFVPGETYTLNITINGSGFRSAVGFNLEVSGGTLVNPGNNVQILSNEATHTNPSSSEPWQVDWQASEADSVIFYFAGNWANGDGGTSGDDPTEPWMRVGFKQTTSVTEFEPGNVQAFQLFQNYPNPFNSETKIRYQIAASGAVELKVFDVLGKLVYETQQSHASAGHYQFTWNGTNSIGENLPSGVYFYQVKNHKNDVRIQKLLLIK